MFIRICGQMLLVKSWCGERGNSNNIYMYAVSVMRDSIVVGHLPRKISPVALLFSMKDGPILCQVLGRRRQCGVHVSF